VVLYRVEGKLVNETLGKTAWTLGLGATCNLAHASMANARADEELRGRDGEARRIRKVLCGFLQRGRNRSARSTGAV
jgi:hypothetical protein